MQKETQVHHEIQKASFGEHNLLVYYDIEVFREIYCTYAKTHLNDSEILLIVSYYESVDKVRNNLRNFGVNVDSHEKDGTLVIVDSVKGYQSDKDHTGILKLAITLADRAQKEGRKGVCAFGDVGSFHLFDRITELLKYELSIPTRFGIKLKAFCSYHQADYGRLDDEQKRVLVDNHFHTLMPET